MIRGLMSAEGVDVSNGTAVLPYISQVSSNPMQGIVRVWGTELQTFDGCTWQNITSGYATIGLDKTTRDLLEWARKKKQEEEVLLSLSSDNPAVKIARENVNRAKQALKDAEEKLKLTTILSEE